ncbi:hypothetical protein TRAPUB_12361 [Trametes pubescens]|uniref:Uncharacterized protein n=1 Tax=Trametes pubescens TaxID=154538 RepID=A0A1M2VUB4_TRAPU|nr:hypothetical protein TRAPUB_12361 [Trametes pubescens]
MPPWQMYGLRSRHRTSMEYSLHAAKDSAAFAIGIDPSQDRRTSTQKAARIMSMKPEFDPDYSAANVASPASSLISIVTAVGFAQLVQISAPMDKCVGCQRAKSSG